MPGNLGQRRDLDRGQVLTISGRAISTLRVPVWKGASISGRLFDASGRPLRGVMVHAFGEVPVAGRLSWRHHGQGQTDNQGAFRILDLVEGQYLVVAGQGFPEKTAPTFFPSADEPSQAVLIGLATGEDRMAVDIFQRNRRTFDIAGRVQAGPIDLRNTSARLTIPNGEARSYFVAGFAPVGPDGTFRFSRIPSGDYWLEVYSAPRAGSWVGEETDLESFKPPVLNAQGLARGPRVLTRIAVGDRNVLVPDIVLPPVLSIRGQVTVEPGISSAPPALSVMPYAISADGYTSAGGVRDSSTDFTVSALNPGRYFLRFVGSLPAGWAVSSVIANGQPAVDTPVELTDRSVNATVYLTNQVAEISGTVRDPSKGTFDPDSSVLAFPIDPRKWLDNGRNDPRIRSARADADGTFSLVGLPPGDYFIVGLKEEHARDWQTAANLGALAAVATKIKIGTGQKLSLTVTSVPRPPGR